MSPRLAGLAPLGAVLVVAAGLRLYWFGSNASLWPDEAVYLLGAQAWAGLADYSLPAARPPGLPLLGSGLYRLGLGEGSLRATLLLFSLWGVLLLGRLGAEAYGRGVGAVAALLLAVFSVHLFFTERVLTDVPALSLWLLVLLLAWRGVVTRESPRAAFWLGPAVALLLLVRFAYVLLLPSLALLLLVAGGARVLRDRRLWGSAGLGLLPLLPYLAWAWAEHGSPLAALTQRGEAVSPTYAAKVASTHASGLSAYLRLMPEAFLDPLLVTLVAAGLLLAVRDRLRPGQPGGPRDRRRPSTDPRRDLCIVLLGVGSLVAIPLIGHNEARFLLPVFPPAFLLAAHATLRLHAAVAARSRVAAALAVAALLAWPCTVQIRRADALIARSAGSFALHRRVGEWLGENTPPGSRVFAAEPEISQYYSGRPSRWYPATASEFDRRLAQAGGDYAVFVAGAQSQPRWLAPWLRARGIEAARAWKARDARELAGVYPLPEAPGRP